MYAENKIIKDKTSIGKLRGKTDQWNQKIYSFLIFSPQAASSGEDYSLRKLLCFTKSETALLLASCSRALVLRRGGIETVSNGQFKQTRVMMIYLR